MFEMGFCLGMSIAIIAMIFIPWKSFGRRNIKVADNTTRDAIIADAVEAWREWVELPEKYLTDWLVESMNKLSDYERDNSARG